MRYFSLFSGIEACSVAWKPLGWECAGVAEIEAFPSAVLAHHYPRVPNLGDVTKITDEQIAALGPIDLVVGGSPCQDLSVAGKRAGLAGERSGLFHEQLRIFHAARTVCGARWLLWENVPGAFSTHGGRDFGVVVSSMAGADYAVPRGGWGTCGAAIGPNGLVEWRVLDAQYVRVESHPAAVPQRRRRVFALLDSGNWRDRPPVLLEPEGLLGHPAPRREAGQGTSGVPARGVDIGKSLRATDGGIDREDGHTLIPAVCGTLSDGAHMGGGLNGQDAYTGRIIPVVGFAQNQRDEVRQCAVAGALAAEPGMKQQTYIAQPAIAFSCKDHGADAGEVSPTLRSMNGLDGNTNGGGYGNANDGLGVSLEHTPPHSVSQVASVACPSLTATNDPSRSPQSSEVTQQVAAVHAAAMQVRRLTPRERERLQGFPDDYTAITVRGKPAADGPRYRALGNSMAVNCMRWIGERIEAVLAHAEEKDAA